MHSERYEVSSSTAAPIEMNNNIHFSWPNTIGSNLPTIGPNMNQLHSSFLPRQFISRRRQRRHRTAFSEQQLFILEREYMKSPYINRDRRVQLSFVLDKNEKIIKIWFQNRRMKDKKDSLDLMYESQEVNTSDATYHANNLMPILSEVNTSDASYHANNAMPILSNQYYPPANYSMNHMNVIHSTPAASPYLMNNNVTNPYTNINAQYHTIDELRDECKDLIKFNEKILNEPVPNMSNTSSTSNNTNTVEPAINLSWLNLDVNLC